MSRRWLEQLAEPSGLAPFVMSHWFYNILGGRTLPALVVARRLERGLAMLFRTLQICNRKTPSALFTSRAALDYSIPPLR